MNWCHFQSKHIFISIHLFVCLFFSLSFPLRWSIVSTNGGWFDEQKGLQEEEKNESNSILHELNESTGYQVTRVSGKPLGPVRCSVCNSSPKMNGSECIDNPKKFEIDCIAPVTSHFGPYTGCRKIEQWIDFEINASDNAVSPPNYRVIRQCAYFANNEDRECIHSGSIGAQQLVCFCQGAGCNGDFSVKSDRFIIFIIMTSVLFHLTKQLPSTIWCHQSPSDINFTIM